MFSEKKLKEQEKENFGDSFSPYPDGFDVKEVQKGIKKEIHVYKNGILDRVFRFWDQAWFYLENQ